MIASLDDFTTRERPRGPAVLAIPARSTPQPRPSPAEEGYGTGRFAWVRTSLEWPDTAVRCDLLAYVRHTPGGPWYAGLRERVLGRGYGNVTGNTVDWFIGPETEVLFVIEGLDLGVGGGTVAVELQGIVRGA